jgi:hypothetical protein
MRSLWLVILLATGGCGRRGSLYEGAIAPLPLVGTSNALVQVVPATRRAVIVTPGATSPSAVVIGSGARVASRVPGADLVAILSGTARAPRLELLDTGTRELTVLDPGSAFDRLTFSPEGRFAVLTADFEKTSGLAARNLNEAALLDVPSRTVTRLQLDVEGLAPRLVTFGPVETNRRLVAVALERGVALFDATRPEVPARRITLRPPGSTVENSVSQVLFSRDARWLFLRATGLDDVVVIELGPETGAPVSASINFVAGGTGLVDLELAPPSLGDSVLALYAGIPEIVVLDARGIEDNVRRLPLSQVMGAMERLSDRRVIVWGPSVAAVWDVVDGRSGVATLLGTPEKVTISASSERVMLSQANSATAPGVLTALTVSEEPNRLRLRTQPIQLARKPTASAVSVDGETMFLAVPPGTGSAQTALVTVEVRTLALTEVLLDAPVVNLFQLSSSGVLVAEHSVNVLGDVSLVPAGATERLSVTRLSDFALTGDLDRPEDRP